MQENTFIALIPAYTAESNLVLEQYTGKIYVKVK